MHPLFDLICEEIKPDTILTSKTGANGFIITPDGRMFDLKEKYSHDIAICAIYWDQVKDVLEEDIDFDALFLRDGKIHIHAASSVMVNGYTDEIPVIRFTERYSYNSHLKYYDLWFDDNAITPESFMAFRFIAYNIYGLTGFEEVDGPTIPGHTRNINSYKVYMQNIKDQPKTLQATLSPVGDF